MDEGQVQASDGIPVFLRMTGSHQKHLRQVCHDQTQLLPSGYNMRNGLEGTRGSLTSSMAP